MAIHFSILAWRIPWTEEPGGLQSTALQGQTLLKRLSTHAVKKTKESHWQNVSVNILYSCKCFGICSWSWRQEPRMVEGCILCCVCFVPESVFALLFQWKKKKKKENTKTCRGSVERVAWELQNPGGQSWGAGSSNPGHPWLTLGPWPSGSPLWALVFLFEDRVKGPLHMRVWGQRRDNVHGPWDNCHSVKVNSLSCVWLCNPMDCSLPGSSIHGISQARVLEWVAIAFSGY